MKNKKFSKIFLFSFMSIFIIYNAILINAQDLSNTATLKCDYKIDTFEYQTKNLSYILSYPTFENNIINEQIKQNLENIINNFLLQFNEINEKNHLQNEKVALDLQTDVSILPMQNLLFIRFCINRHYITLPSPITSYESHIYRLNDFKELEVEDIFNDYSNLLYLKSKEYFKNNYDITIDETSDYYFYISPKIQNYRNIFMNNKYFEFTIFDYKNFKDNIIRINLEDIQRFIKPEFSNNVNIFTENITEITTQEKKEITTHIQKIVSTLQPISYNTDVSTETTSFEYLEEALEETTLNQEYNNMKDMLDYNFSFVVNDILIDLYKISKDLLEVKKHSEPMQQINQNIEQPKLEQSEATKLKSERNIDINKPMIALTFDDGPNGNITSKILDILEKNNARATFFVVGRRLDTDAEILKRMINMGNQIGNHTYNHKNLSQISNDQIQMEIDTVNKKLEKYTGKSASVVRVPYGATDIDVISNVKYPLIMWNVDTKDWKTKNKDDIISEIRTNAKDGNIILMHDLYESTVKACEIIIPELVKKGFQLVTVEEMMQYKGIELKSGQKYYNARKNRNG